MPSKVTIRDVAARAGVSQATASRVLSNAGQTSEQARAAVQQAAQDLGYLPNALARSLRIHKTGVIALLVSDIRNPHFALLAHRIQTLLASRGYAVILGNASEDEDTQERFLTHVSSQRVDGLIVAPQNSDSPALRRLADSDVPLIFVDRLADGLTVPYAISDARTGLRAAFDHLAALGHRRCGFIAGPLGTSTGRERHDYFLAEAPGCFGDGVHVELGGVPAGPRTALRRVREAGCTAVIFGYGPHTEHCLPTLKDDQVSIPRDLSLVTVDDFPLFRAVTPALTVVQQDVDAMGAAAVELVLAAISGTPAEDVTLPTTLVVRDSTAAPTRSSAP